MRIILLVFFTSFLYSEFIFNPPTEDNTTNVLFNMDEFMIESKQEYSTIKTSSKSTTQNFGQPQLPTYTFNYSINSSKEYDVDYVVMDYDVYQNIDLYPEQNVIGDFTKDISLYESKSIYPLNKLNSKRQSLRGYEILSVELIPFEYDFERKELKVYTEVEIEIQELGSRENSNIRIGSEVFRNLYSNLVNNNEVLDNRAIQKPSILYIIEDFTSILNPLIEWRRKQGYIVNVADSDDISGSFNTTNIKNYISNAYNNWENPPEFVCLVGDANGSYEVPTYTVGQGNGWSGAYGEGDFPYALIDGNDLYPDIIMGRISVRSSAELATVVNKIIGYEKNYSNSTDWMTSAALVGDPYDSGISTVITNEYIEEIIGIHGGIDDVRTKYSGSGYDSWMRTQINEGVSYLNYRGFYGFSGFTADEVDGLSNGFKLPFLTTLTCDTGTFAEYDRCITESLFTAGSAATPRGAVAVIGTAQPYTHTAFNNIVTMGIYDGIFIKNVQTAGEALIYGQLELANIYPQNPNNNVYYFATWNSLLGDPATHLWTRNPEVLNVTHSEVLTPGSTNFQVNVTRNASGEPFSGALVSLYDPSNEEMHLTAISDENGVANFNINTNIGGNVHVTTRCQNCIPVETMFEVNTSGTELTLDESSISVIDTSGNGDGVLNPGESARFSFTINNLSIQQVNDLSIELTSNSDFITVSDSDLYLGSVSPAGNLNVNGFLVNCSSDAIYGETPKLSISLFNASETLSWTYDLPISYAFGNLSLIPIVSGDDNNNGVLDRGETGLLTFSAVNDGLIPLNDVVVIAYNSNPNLSISSNEFTFGNISVGTYVNSNAIQISAPENAIHGSIISIPVDVITSNGLEYSTVTQVQVGELSVNDPMGPDSHGYYIYDMNDNLYELAPDYDWIEIDPDYGGQGSSVGLNDWNQDGGDNADDVVTVDLPFPFTFYGIEYNQISICSNGWVSFGETQMRSFRNYTLPGVGGPSPIVAVFWDDLTTGGSGDVYTYYDQQTSSFIIEWSEVTTYFNGTLETFQLILYDTGWQTPTGDDEMKIQFKEFNNNSVGAYPVGNYDGPVVHGQYCTVGIENHLCSDGLQYTFNNSYHPAAMTLSDETAIFITTRTNLNNASPSADLNVNELYFELAENQTSTNQVILSNDGENNSVLFYSAKASPFITEVNNIDDYGYAWTESNSNNIDYNWIDIEDDNQVVTLPDNDGGGIVNMNFQFPFYGNQYNYCAVMANGWIGFEATEQSWNNQSIFSEESPKGAILGFWDDLYPESLENDEGSGNIRYHSNNERLVVWYDNVRHWVSADRFYDFQIVLYADGRVAFNYRNMNGATDSSTIGIIDFNGDYGLEVLYNQDNFINNEMSVLFDLTPSWIDVSPESGQIFYAQSNVIDVEASSIDLSSGIYDAYVLIGTNSEENETISIPVTLNFSANYGDVNQDGIIDVLDLVRLVGIILNNYIPTDIEYTLSDLNDDGIVDVLDIVTIVNIILS